MTDAFSMLADAVSAPARRTVTVTPSDSTDLPELPKALWVSGAGTLKVVGTDDTSNTGTDMGSLAAGTLVPVRARRVLATGTTATVVGLL